MDVGMGFGNSKTQPTVLVQLEKTIKKSHGASILVSSLIINLT